MAKTVYMRTPYCSTIQKATYVKKIADGFICVADELGNYKILHASYIVPKAEAIKEYNEIVKREALTIVARAQSHSIEIKDLIKELRCMKYHQTK